MLITEVHREAINRINDDNDNFSAIYNAIVQKGGSPTQNDRSTYAPEILDLSDTSAAQVVQLQNEIATYNNYFDAIYNSLVALGLNPTYNNKQTYSQVLDSIKPYLSNLDNQMDGGNAISDSASAYATWNIIKKIMNSSRAILPDNTTASYASIMMASNNVNVFAVNCSTTRVLKLSDYGGSVSLLGGTLTIELGTGTPNSINLYIDLSNISASVDHIIIKSVDAEAETNTLTINNLVIIDSITNSMPNNTDVTIGVNSSNYVMQYTIQYFRADTLSTQDQKLLDDNIPLTINGTNNVNSKNISPIFDLQ